MRLLTRGPAAAGLALLLAALAGCGGPRPADPSVARSALTAGLDAWKAGQKPDSLKSHTPPVQFGDEDWIQGHKLLDYEVLGDGKSAGAGLEFSVKLKLEGRKVGERTVPYRVMTDPAVSVVRQEPPPRPAD
jgi:hypothetical protein